MAHCEDERMVGEDDDNDEDEDEEEERLCVGEMIITRIM